MGRQVSEHDIIALSELNPDITLPWIIDEFDASFNELAQATLRYHLYHDGTVCPTHLVPIYEQLIADFEPHAYPTHFASCEDVLCERCQAFIFNEHERINAVRKRFVDIMPTLWS